MDELEPRHLLSGISEFPVTMGSFPESIIPGPDGNLWFTEEPDDPHYHRIPDADRSARINFR
jgi:streptogramin lyase